MGDGINGGANAILINYDEWNDFLRYADLLDDDDFRCIRYIRYIRYIPLQVRRSVGRRLHDARGDYRLHLVAHAHHCAPRSS